MKELNVKNTNALNMEFSGFSTVVPFYSTDIWTAFMATIYMDPSSPSFFSLFLFISPFAIL